MYNHPQHEMTDPTVTIRTIINKYYRLSLSFYLVPVILISLKIKDAAIVSRTNNIKISDTAFALDSYIWLWTAAIRLGTLWGLCYTRMLNNSHFHTVTLARQARALSLLSLGFSTTQSIFYLIIVYGVGEDYKLNVVESITYSTMQIVIIYETIVLHIYLSCMFGNKIRAYLAENPRQPGDTPEIRIVVRKIIIATPEDAGVECSICINNIATGETLQELTCGHKFHMTCVSPWMDEHGTCPMCRAFA